MTQSGKPDMRYVRLGTDIWFDSGTGSYAKSKASDNYVNLDFQNYFLDSIVGAAETQGFEYQPSRRGHASTESRRRTIAWRTTISRASWRTCPVITPADFGADIWVSDADGSLLRLTWGPQATDKAQPQTGYDYTVTAVDCDCAIRPPA